MFTVDHRFLAEVGLEDLPAAVQEDYMRAIEGSIRAAVISRLVHEMTEEEFEELEAVIEHGPAAAHAWMQINLPRFHEVQRQELALLRPLLATDAPELLELELAFALAAAADRPTHHHKEQ